MQADNRISVVLIATGVQIAYDDVTERGSDGFTISPAGITENKVAPFRPISAHRATLSI
jgi:hypothetical protein